MTYETYLSLGRADLLERLQETLSPHRFQHVLNVEQAAIQLAQAYGQDPVKAGLAGLLHDYAKEKPDAYFQTLIAERGLDPDLLQWGNNIWHGYLGIYAIQDELGLEDEEILDAIRVHTIGKADMSPLDMILYLADYIEADRNFPGVEEARRLAYSSLEEGVAYETAETLAFLAKKGIPIYPQTLETYNAYRHFLER
ncbi:bis(5'-nucleosyl)-tetraphosphatase (symmetrical) YqeK [Streptococcus danieliae]|uniref:bis(5'-nucleosyl)-tetraphosphatase (symmetrical) n=1 Tax=Streptococcus danieliae TaxID=747656 RepID=A0A7X3G875_9STRE|nr:bis(5'-nucleosyl)-tetraphosphatase (symmetrical) YqeK [Streptococcus danieliae]MCU0082546.1 bis(5'-nucleosyl)-tetraphosphatase (symmetrical) YqeK [Streptococcus danieliae]MVX58742.1 HD domain-containing protein [Streptococcus danieliae]